MAASVLVQSVPNAISYVNCYVKHTGLTLFIKMTHGFNLGRCIWRKCYFKPEGLKALCTRKSRQSKIYIWLWTSGAGTVFYSLFQWNSAQAMGFLTCAKKKKTPKCVANSKLIQTRTSLQVDWFHVCCEFRLKKKKKKGKKSKLKTKGVFSFLFSFFLCGCFVHF